MGNKSYSKGISWIDDCRIPYTKTDKETINFDRPRVRELKEDRDWILTQAHDFTNPDFKEYNTDGRFPANLLVCDDMLNDGIDRIGFNGGGGPTRFAGATGGNKLDNYNYYADKGSSSRYYDIDKWFENIISE